MRVLVVGSGAREHALCLALAQDSAVSHVVAAPGNPGTAAVAENRELPELSPQRIASLADTVDADLTLIGPEQPLVAGAADLVRDRGRQVFGPGVAAARLEGSKAFAKQVMAAAGVPTAQWTDTEDLHRALAALEQAEPPYVVKQDGLAGGKGVTVTDSRGEAEQAVRDALEHGRRVVVEEYLDGPEVSLFAVVTESGEIRPWLPAQDAKRVGDGDTGPNTGGMGAYAPLPWAPPDLVEQVTTSVLEPTVRQLERQGSPFSGLLYAGLALTASGPKVIEFNVRFGDPETQVLLALLDTPLTQVLAGAEPRWKPGAVVCVVVAAPGYPQQPRTGDPVRIGALPADVSVLHAGTARGNDAELRSAGGRVLAVTGRGADLATARAAAYAGVAAIRLDGAHARTDIAAAASGWIRP